MTYRHSLFLFNIVLEVLAKAMRKKESSRTEKEERKCYICQWYIYVPRKLKITQQWSEYMM